MLSFFMRIITTLAALLAVGSLVAVTYDYGIAKPFGLAYLDPLQGTCVVFLLLLLNMWFNNRFVFSLHGREAHADSTQGDTD